MLVTRHLSAGRSGRCKNIYNPEGTAPTQTPSSTFRHFPATAWSQWEPGCQTQGAESPQRPISTSLEFLHRRWAL